MQRQDLSPKHWGPSGWSFLDAVTAGYPSIAMQQEQLVMTKFLESLGFALPCEKCRTNFRVFTASNPPGLAVWGKQGLAMWLRDLKRHIEERG
jgi:Erv1 / Alr family